MRGKLLIIFALLFFCAQNLSAQSYDVKVVIEDIESTKGDISLGVFQNGDMKFREEHACDGAILKAVVPRVEHSFSLPAGKYAFVAYQDTNSNGKLDTNWIGYPSEPFAFSNDPTIPRYSAIEVKVTSDCTVELEF